MDTFTQLLTEAAGRPDPRLLKQWLGKVHEQDAVEAMNAMPVESVDMVVTSPPYNIKNSTGNGLKCGRGGGSGRKRPFRTGMRHMMTICHMKIMWHGSGNA